jgi:hypothetical protein
VPSQLFISIVESCLQIWNHTRVGL